MRLQCHSILLSFLIIPWISWRTLNSCQNSSNPVRSIRVDINIPVVTREGQLLQNPDFFQVYYKDNLILYNFPTSYDSSVDGKIISSGYWNNFFVYEKGSAVGYLLNKDSTQRYGQRVSVDSMLNTKGLQNFQWHLMLNRQPISSREDSDGVLREIYLGPNQYDKNINDSIIFSYSNKFREYDFSFSKKLDSIKGKKLFKIQILYPDVYSPEHKITFPKKETFFEMREGRVENPAEIQQVFDSYRHYKK